MILDELNGHLGLLEDLEMTRAIRAGFLAKAQPGAASMTGMPHSSDIKDKVGNLAVELAELDAQIETLERLVLESEKKILPFLDSIQDIRARMALRLRFLRGMSWGEVAGIFGRRFSEESIKKTCYRYLGLREERDEKERDERTDYFKTLF